MMTPAEVFVMLAPAVRIVAALAVGIGGAAFLMKLVTDFGETPTWDGAMATLGFGAVVLLLTVAGVIALVTIQ